MLSVWWDQKGIIYYEILENRQTVTADLYSQQLMQLNQALDENRPYSGKGRRKVVILQDNARPHIAKKTQDTLEKLGWEVLPHPAYSPDLAPSDYHLFRSMEHFFREKNFLDLESIKKDLGRFFDLKPPSFYEKGIHLLPVRWEKVIKNNGHYFND